MPAAHEGAPVQPEAAGAGAADGFEEPDPDDPDGDPSDDEDDEEPEEPEEPDDPEDPEADSDGEPSLSFLALPLDDEVRLSVL